jgi:putative flippase GtrA
MELPPQLDALAQRLIPDPDRRAIFLKAVNFAMVGVINALVDLGVFSFGYYVAGLPIIPANLISWSVAVTGSYVMNSKTTFAAESGRRLTLKAYVTFLAAQVAGFLANMATLWTASYFMPVFFGKVLSIGASFVVNFTLSHFVVFRPRRPSTSDLEV